MASAAVLLLAAFFISSAAAAAVDVMEILRPEPDFSTFTEFLDKTKVAQDITSLHTATVLALDNDAMAAVTALPPAVAREVLSLHVLLDYYDPDTLDRDFKKDKTALLATLLQVTRYGGASVGDTFLNYTERADQSMYFGSTAPGAAQDSELIKVVGARPYDLSVLHISKAILSPSIVGGSTGAPSSVSAAPVPTGGKASSVVSGITASPVASTPAQAPASAAERVVVGAALGLGVAVAVAVAVGL